MKGSASKTKKESVTYESDDTNNYLSEDSFPNDARSSRSKSLSLSPIKRKPGRQSKAGSSATKKTYEPKAPYTHSTTVFVNFSNIFSQKIFRRVTKTLFTAFHSILTFPIKKSCISLQSE